MLYALGSNGRGQLGLGHNEDVNAPTAVSLAFNPDEVVRIVAGGNHTLILLKDGTLYATGDNTHGQCGTAWLHDKMLEPVDRFAPTFAPYNKPREPWVHCSSTWEATTMVDRKHDIFSCGSGLKGELGFREPIISAPTPAQIFAFPPEGLSIDDLAASMGHTVAVLTDGSVYGWGNGRKGQLGMPAQVQHQPRKIDQIPFPVTKAVCGRDFTFLAGSQDTGECTVIGSDKFGLQEEKPSSIAAWKQIGATWGSVFVLLKNGRLLRWGRNDHGQLGPEDLPPLEMIATGSEHVLALTKAGEVLAWGWGEHGNCGALTDSNGDAKGGYNVLQVRGRCRYLAAGCATSWITCDD